MQWLADIFGSWWPSVQLTSWTLIKIIAIVLPLMIAIAYLTLAERKVIGFMQVRIGPNRVGYFGLLQPIADGVKLLFNEIVFPQIIPLGILAFSNCLHSDLFSLGILCDKSTNDFLLQRQ